MIRLSPPALKSSLAVTTGVGCRNLCSYCPQETFMKAYRASSTQSRMSISTFRQCIMTVPTDICLSFSGFCEPWLNPECTGMILHAHKRGFRIRVNTTLAGMTVDDVRLLKGIPFIKFVVHLPDQSGQTRIRTDAQYFDTLTALSASKIPNLVWKFHKTGPGIDIRPEVKKILLDAGCRFTYASLNNRAGNILVNDAYESVNRGRILHPCPDFRHNILLPNGDVSLCHMDWSLQHVLGNLLESSYADLFTGQAFRDLNAALTDPRSDILCRYCEKDIVKRRFTGRISRIISRKIRGKKDVY